MTKGEAIKKVEDWLAKPIYPEDLSKIPVEAIRRVLREAKGR